MTLSDAKAYSGVIASATPAGTNVSNSVLIGESLGTTTYSAADIAYSFSVTQNATGDVATLTLSSGTVAQTTGTPTISPDLTSGGLDFEGNSLSTLATLYAIQIKCTATPSTSIAVTGTLGLQGTLKVTGDVLQFAWSTTGLAITTETVILTWTDTADGAVEVTVVGAA